MYSQCGLIVGNVEGRFVSFSLESVVDTLERCHDVIGGCGGDGDCKDVVWVMSVCDEEKVLSVEVTRWKSSGAVSVKGACLLVNEGSIAKDVSGRFYVSLLHWV